MCTSLPGYLVELKSHFQKACTAQYSCIEEPFKDANTFVLQVNADQKIAAQKVKKSLGERKIFQLIGSFDGLTSEAFKTTKRYLIKRLEKGAFIEYGVTGGEKGVNQALNEVMDENTHFRTQVIANLVSDSFKHTDSFPKVLPAYLTYISGESTFGDDNRIANEICDTAIVCGGGMQTFDQVIDLLRQKKKICVIMCCDSNGMSNDVHAAEKRFSVGDLLERLRNARNEEMEAVAQSYVFSLGLKRETSDCVMTYVKTLCADQQNNDNYLRFISFKNPKI